MSITSPASGTLFTSDTFREWVDSVCNHVNTQELRISPTQQTVNRQIWISITGSTLPGSTLAWEYDWKQVIPSVLTHTLIWDDSVPPLTSSTTGYGPAYNSLESNNPVSLAGGGTLPIGVPLPQTGTLQPFGVGAIFLATLVQSDGIVYPVFTGVNSITC